MTNKILLTAVAILIVIAAVVVALAYTYLDIGLAPKGGGALRVALQSFSAETLDPSLDTQDGLRYHAHMYDYLTGANPEGMLDTRYGLLSEWSVNADGSSFALTLREGVRWHDGERVIADDIRSSLEYYFRDGAACGVCGNVSASVASVEVIDERSATLHLSKPDVVFMGLLAPIEGDMPLLPSHILDGDGVSALPSSPIGSGPWRFADRAEGGYVEYEANKDYWNMERVSPFDALHISLVPEEDTRNALLKTGKLEVSPISTASISDVKSDGFAVDGPKNVISTAMRFFMGYDEDYLTSSLEFRKALAVSVNMPEIVAVNFAPEAASVATGSALFTPTSPGYVEALSHYEYDPEQARALLEQTGYAGEPVNLMSLVAYGLSEMPRINEMVAEQWRAVGINAEVISTEWPAVQPRALARPQEFAEFAPAPVLHGAAPARPGGDINDIRRYISGAEGAMLTYFAPKVGDAMLAQVAAVSDDAERALTLQALNRKTYAEYWAIPILWRHNTYAISPDLSDWQPTDGTPSALHFETLRRTR